MDICAAREVFEENFQLHEHVKSQTEFQSCSFAEEQELFEIFEHSLKEFLHLHFLKERYPKNPEI